MKHFIAAFAAATLSVSLLMSAGCNIQLPGQNQTGDQSSGKTDGKGKMEADGYIPPAPGDEEEPAQNQGQKQGQKQSQKQGQKQGQKQDQNQDQNQEPEQK